MEVLKKPQGYGKRKIPDCPIQGGEDSRLLAQRLVEGRGVNKVSLTLFPQKLPPYWSFDEENTVIE